MGDQGHAPDSLCRCGHVQAAHEHYRRGTDCGICGRDSCPAFAAAPAQAQPAEAQPADATAGRRQPNSA